MAAIVTAKNGCEYGENRLFEHAVITNIRDDIRSELDTLASNSAIRGLMGLHDKVDAKTDGLRDNIDSLRDKVEAGFTEIRQSIAHSPWRWNRLMEKQGSPPSRQGSGD